MARVTFIMEQHLGHQTYYQNIRSFVETSDQVQATWVPVTYSGSSGLWDRVKALPSHIRGTLRGRQEVRQGLAHATSDVVFFNTQVPAVLGGNLTRRYPYTISTDLTPIQYDQVSLQYGHQPDRPGPLATYKHRTNIATLNGAARLFPWSNWARGSLIADYGVDPQKIEVIPPGVDLTRWIPGARQETGPLRILFVGGDLYRKGGDVLLRAFRTLSAGTAELILVTKSQVQPEQGVRIYNDLQPNSPVLMNLFRTSDVFVLPTAAEAFGIAAIEASAVGLAAIVTAVGGLTDIVVDGENGFLIQPDDIKTLSHRLCMLAADPGLRERMGRAARQRAEAYFDARKNTSRLISYLLEVAARK
jgi:glycosyltransferase involved in cell wall biosynthesis